MQEKRRAEKSETIENCRRLVDGLLRELIEPIPLHYSIFLLWFRFPFHTPADYDGKRKVNSLSFMRISHSS